MNETLRRRINTSSTFNIHDYWPRAIISTGAPIKLWPYIDLDYENADFFGTYGKQFGGISWKQMVPTTSYNLIIDIIFGIYGTENIGPIYLFDTFKSYLSVDPNIYVSNTSVRPITFKRYTSTGAPSASGVNIQENITTYGCVGSGGHYLKNYMTINESNVTNPPVMWIQVQYGSTQYQKSIGASVRYQLGNYKTILGTQSTLYNALLSAPGYAPSIQATSSYVSSINWSNAGNFSAYDLTNFTLFGSYNGNGTDYVVYNNATPKDRCIIYDFVIRRQSSVTTTPLMLRSLRNFYPDIDSRPNLCCVHDEYNGVNWPYYQTEFMPDKPYINTISYWHPDVCLSCGMCGDICSHIADAIHPNDTTGEYFINPERCIDCGDCIDNCPFGGSMIHLIS